LKEELENKTSKLTDQIEELDKKVEEIDGEDDSYDEEDVDSDQDLDSELNDNFDVNDVNKRDSEDSQKLKEDGKMCSESDEDELDADLDSQGASKEGSSKEKQPITDVKLPSQMGSGEQVKESAITAQLPEPATKTTRKLTSDLDKPSMEASVKPERKEVPKKRRRDHSVADQSQSDMTSV